MTFYSESAPAGYLEVTYIVKETGAKLTRTFTSEWECNKFVNKLRHSKKCKLVSYPFFS